ncbi:MAG: TIGR00366 family protein [Phycisphaerales bacterium]
MLARAVSSLGARLSEVFRRTAPDPFVLAILLTIVAAALALTLGDFPNKPADQSRALYLLDRWRADDGLWRFLPFAMQMCLVLVTGHALAASRPVRALVRSLASMPRSAPSAAALVGVVAAGAGMLNWGLGLIVGAIFARDVERAMQRRAASASTTPARRARGTWGCSSGTADCRGPPR